PSPHAHYTLSLHDALPIWPQLHAFHDETYGKQAGDGKEQYPVEAFGDSAIAFGGIGQLHGNSLSGWGSLLAWVKQGGNGGVDKGDRKSTRLNSSHVKISYA